MNFKSIQVYRARDAAKKVEAAISHLARVDGMFFDGKNVFLRCIPYNQAYGPEIERIIQQMQFDPTAYTEDGYFQIYFPLNKRRTERPAWVMNLILFLITVGTTYLNGMLMFAGDGISIWMSGFLFSSSLLAILGTHEFGHYFLSLFHRVKATLPYFLPAPPFPFTPVGTFGAFIKMKSPVPNLIALFDVGIAGPLAGFVVALPITIWGISQSEVIQLSQAGEFSFQLGNSLLFIGLTELFGPPTPEGYDLLLHPVVYAGWIGLFITALNLMPIGQLDGGHIIYALLPRWHRYIARITFFVILGLGLYYKFYGWFLWAALILFLIRIDHPPTRDDDQELDVSRKMLGYLAIIIFLITFTPQPFIVGNP